MQHMFACLQIRLLACLTPSHPV